MAEYLVTWKIGIVAKTPQEAVAEALVCVRHGVSTVFTATNKDTGEKVNIDADNGEIYPDD